MRSVAIVDAYSSGSLLAPLFRERDYRAIHIQSQETIPPDFARSFVRKDFHENIIHRTIEDSVRQLKELNVEQVLSGGVDSAVELADALSNALGALTNGTSLSAARRDKWLMVKALESAGIRTIPSKLVHSLADARTWARNKYPVVAKPRRSAGTDNVWLCDSWPQLEGAFKSIANRTTLFGEINDGVLLQEYIEGTEYIVDTVCSRNSVAVTEICQYRKKPLKGTIVYDVVELLPSTGLIQAQLSSYAVSVLKALGIKFGPCHFEIMIDHGGPVLVEVGARLDGARAPELCQAATNQNQAEMTVLCYTDPRDFERRARTPYSMHKHLLRVHLISERSGTIVGLPFLDALKELPSFHSINRMLGPGDFLPLTTTLLNLPGIIDLIHPCQETIWDDYKQIREWESAGFFQLEAPHASAGSAPTAAGL
jgi:predicted ATP-grasp superfamily ATP-dependent carboligase